MSKIKKKWIEINVQHRENGFVSLILAIELSFCERLQPKLSLLLGLFFHMHEHITNCSFSIYDVSQFTLLFPIFICML